MNITKKIFNDRAQYYNDKGELHRENGLDIEYSDGGDKYWRLMVLNLY